jgi:hypothetical protein
VEPDWLVQSLFLIDPLFSNVVTRDLVIKPQEAILNQSEVVYVCNPSTEEAWDFQTNLDCKQDSAS